MQKMLSKCSRQPYRIAYDPSVRHNKHLHMEYNAHLLERSVLYCRPAVREYSWRIGAGSTGPICRDISASLIRLCRESNCLNRGIDTGVKQARAEQTPRSSPKVAAQNHCVSAYQIQRMFSNYTRKMLAHLRFRFAAPFLISHLIQRAGAALRPPPCLYFSNWIVSAVARCVSL